MTKKESPPTRPVRKRDKFDKKGVERRGAIIGGMLQAIVNGGGLNAAAAQKTIDNIREDPNR